MFSSGTRSILSVRNPAKKIISSEDGTFVALFESYGTVIAIPDMMFSYDKRVNSVDNYAFLTNVIKWLVETSSIRK